MNWRHVQGIPCLRLFTVGTGSNRPQQLWSAGGSGNGRWMEGWNKAGRWKKYIWKKWGQWIRCECTGGYTWYHFNVKRAVSVLWLILKPDRWFKSVFCLKCSWPCPFTNGQLTSLLILIVKSLMWSEEQKNNISVITDQCDCLLDVSRCFSGV